MTTHTNIRRVAALAYGLPLLVAAGSASAQPTQAQQSAIRANCRSDYTAHCSSVPSGRPSLMCLQEHVDELSPTCQKAVKATMSAPAAGAAPAAPAAGGALPQLSLREEAQLMRGSCGSDFDRYCSNVKLGGGRGLGCLAHNEERLAPQCKSALAELRNR
jgi:hypothetical protein